MIKKDFHLHTNFCDGLNSPEEMVISAIALNVKEIGLVCHSYTPCDESYCIKREKIQPFIAEVNRLKLKYNNAIKIYCGVEYDYFAEMPIEGFDFIIGAVHYVCKDGRYIPVDESKELLIEVVQKYYNADFYAFCEDYYKTLADIYSKVSPDFIAHFDLVCKFNNQSDLFDENNIRYISAWKQCADKILQKNATFELNVGAIIRGYKDIPYPSKEQIEYIKKAGGKFIINSDSHSQDTIAFNYEKYIHCLN